MIVKYGPLMVAGAHKCGGVVFYRGYTGHAARAWRAPTNKRSFDQLRARATLASLSSQWLNTLNAANRIDWETYAATCEFHNSIGDPFCLKGFHLYLRNSYILNNCGHGNAPYTAHTAPISVSGFPNVCTPLFSLNHTTGVLAITDFAWHTTPFMGYFFLIHSLRPVTRTFPYKHFQAIVTLDNSETPPLTIYTFAHPLPGTAGQFATLLTWYGFDIYERVSLEQYVLVPSS